VLVSSQSGEIKVATLEPNSIVGEIAILCDVARTATVRANAPLERCVFRKDHFLKLLAEFPKWQSRSCGCGDRLSHTTAELSEARSNLRRKAELRPSPQEFTCRREKLAARGKDRIWADVAIRCASPTTPERPHD